MAGLVPAVHVLLLAKRKDVDARDKRGHDGGEITANPRRRATLVVRFRSSHHIAAESFANFGIEGPLATL
jgi:hypothetical protein